MKTLGKLKKDSSRPMVRQIENKLKAGIVSGRLSPGHKLPSIRDLSQEMGASVGLTRLAINTLINQGYVYSEERRGIFVAEPWNYRQNIALVLPNMDSDQMSLIFRGVKLGINTGAARLLVQAADYDYAEEVGLLEGLNPSFVSGAVIYPTPLDICQETLREVRRRGVPFVLVNTTYQNLMVPSFCTDSYKVGKLAMEHVVSRGHRKIGFVGHVSPNAIERIEGINEVLLKVGLSWEKLPKVLPQVVLDGVEPWSQGEAAAHKLLEENSDLTAIVGFNAHITSGIVRAVHSRGMVPGKDISVISMSDMKMFAAQVYPITAVRRPFEEMGRLAIQSLLKMMSGEELPPERVCLDPELIDRSSVVNLS